MSSAWATVRGALTANKAAAALAMARVVLKEVDMEYSFVDKKMRLLVMQSGRRPGSDCVCLLP